MTGFKSANSTLVQRVFIILWLVSGQALILILVALDKCGDRLSAELETVAWGGGLIGLFLVLISAIAGFVVVAQMILQEKMCIRM